MIVSGGSPHIYRARCECGKTLTFSGDEVKSKSWVMDAAEDGHLFMDYWVECPCGNKIYSRDWSDISYEF